MDRKPWAPVGRRHDGLADPTLASIHVRLRDGAEKAFLDAYRSGVAGLPGMDNSDLQACFAIDKAAYEVVYEACIGCSICEEVCPVPDCITMHNELEFDHNDSLYALYKQDPDAYRALLEKHGIPLHPELVEKARKTPAVHDVGERKWPVAVAGGEN